MPHDSLERERAFSLKDISKQRDKAGQKKIKVYSSDCYKWKRFNGGCGGEEIIVPYVTTTPIHKMLSTIQAKSLTAHLFRNGPENK